MLVYTSKLIVICLWEAINVAKFNKLCSVFVLYYVCVLFMLYAVIVCYYSSVIDNMYVVEFLKYEKEIETHVISLVH